MTFGSLNCWKASIVLSATLLVLLLQEQVLAQTSSASAREFDVGFMQGFGGSGFPSELRLQIGTSSSSASFTVTDQSGAVISSGMVSPTNPAAVVVPSNYLVTTTGFQGRNRGVHISSDNPVFVVVENFIAFFNHGTYLAYPSDEIAGATTYEYYIISADNSLDGRLSQFLLVGSMSNTNITVTPTENVDIPPDPRSSSSSPALVTAGSSATFMLDRLQTLMVSSLDDLTGTRILSDKPLTVISGHQCANVPHDHTGCEPLAFQVPPASTWGNRFLLAPFAGRATQQKFRVISGEPMTVMYTCGNSSQTINDTTDLVITTSEYCSLASSRPALVVQLSMSGLTDSMGDPAIALVSPTDQYISESTFITLSSDTFPTSYISVTVLAEHFSDTSILLDGSQLNCGWVPIYIPSDEIVGYGCSFPLPTSSNSTLHTVSHNNNGLVSVTVYGFSGISFLGYAYLAGQSIRPTDPVGQFIPFFDLTQFPGVKELDKTVADSVSVRIDIPMGLIFGDKIVTSAYVSENGVISFDDPFKFPLPEPFPTSHDPITQSFVVAPFWSDNDIRREGAVRYVSYSARENTDPDVSGLFSMLNGFIQQSQSDEEEDFVGDWLLIAHWDQVHPSPHGQDDHMGISEAFLNLTNDVQVILISDVVTTFVLFSYDIQWSQMGNGLSAVVGLNARGTFFDNHPLSGMPDIGCAVNGLSCFTGSPSRRKRNTLDRALRNLCLPTQINLRNQALQCLNRFYRLDIGNIILDGSTTQQTPMEISLMLEPCPCTEHQALEDCGRFKPDPSRMRCYITTKPLPLSLRSRAPGATALQQCCYHPNGRLITDSNSGSVVIQFPNNPIINDPMFREQCCNVPGFDFFCNAFFERRPRQDCSGYVPITHGRGWGDPHYVTMDRRSYDFHGSGDYTILEVVPTGASTPVFTMLGRLASLTGWRSTITGHTAIAMGDSSFAFHLGENGLFRVFQTKPMQVEITTTLTNQRVEIDNKVTLRRIGNNLELCHFDSGVKVSADVIRWRGLNENYLNFNVFVPFTYRGQTRGLLGNYDGNGNNEWFDRSGNPLSPGPQFFNGLQSWSIQPTDMNYILLSSMSGRRKRQSGEEFQFFIPDDLNITDAHREFCGDDFACQVDLAATGDFNLAMETIQFQENSTAIQAALDNLPPVITTNTSFRVYVAPSVWELNIAVADPNGDNFTFTFEGGVMNAFQSELVPGSAGVYVYRISITDHSQLDDLQPLEFIATDVRGASSSVVLTLEICGCVNGGECTTDGVLTSDTTIILNCNCPDAYGGDFCEEDRDGCAEFECFEGTICSDVPAPGSGAVCSSCPPGYIGDSQKCYDIDECAMNDTLCDQVCMNTEGGFSCFCMEGYALDEATNQCQDIDECTGSHDCEFGCVNEDGTFRCVCHPRFSLNSDGRTCTPLPEFSCDLECENGECGVVNTSPRVEQCFCDVGYELNGANCIDKDECTLFSPCQHNCTNTPGSFECSCLPGFVLMEDQMSCQDIDECFAAAANFENLCESDPNTRCVNTEGSFQCLCVPGYFRNASGMCVRNSCPSLGGFAGGSITYSESSNDDGTFFPGTVATYSCDAPSTLIGSRTRECGENRQWSGTEPSCELATCDGLVAPANGAITYTGDILPPYDASTQAMYSCNSGYRLAAGSGDEVRTCVAVGHVNPGSDVVTSVSGAWLGAAPTCEAALCSALPMPDHSTVTYSPSANADGDYIIGAIAIFVCDHGYERTSGPLFRTCVTGGTWDGIDVECTALATLPPSGCPDIPDPENGNIDFLDDVDGIYPFDAGTRAVYECDSGYRLDGEMERMCDGLNWSGTAPSCIPITCAPVSAPMSGAVSYSDTDSDGNIPFSGVAMFSCMDGYGLVGARTITCDEDGGTPPSGVFSPIPPTCEPITCSQLDMLIDGVIVYNPQPLLDESLLYGTVATHKCDSVHLLVGSPNRTCTGDDMSTEGYFDGDEPFCQEITCPRLDAPEGGQVEYSSNTDSATYDLGVMASYSCADGYSLENGDEQRLCQLDAMGVTGIWSGSAPECVGTCASLTAPADGSISYSTAPDENNEYLSGTLATFICDEGFEVFGESTRMCQHNMTWTNSQPSCQVVCPGLEDIDFGILTYSSDVNINGRYSVGTTASYECVINYRIIGMESRVCESDMEWSGIAPVCEPITCADLPDPDNGNILFMADDTAPFDLGTVATFKCYPGFVLVGNFENLTCMADHENDMGYWDGTAPTCEAVTCDPIPSPDNTGIEYSTNADASGSYSFGTEVSHMCDPGYSLASGDETRTCEMNGGSTTGIWSGVEVVCEVIVGRCPDIANPEHGRVTFDHESLAPVLPGTNATYSCDLGYGLEGGDEVRTCEMNGFSPDGVWSGMAPTCVAIITCPQLEAPTNGTVTYSVDIETEAIGFGAVATYSCDHVSLGVRGDRVRVCKPGNHGYEYGHRYELIGIWSEWNPTCELIQCPDIADPVNGQIIFAPDRRAPFDYGTTAEHSCYSGYQLVNQDFAPIGEGSQRVCGGDGLSDVGKWSQDDFFCAQERQPGLNPEPSSRVFDSLLTQPVSLPEIVDVQFEQSSYEVMEGDSATVCVLVSGSLEKDLVVEVTSETDTAHGSGKDYFDISKQLTFTKSDKRCLNISTIQDSVYEEDETLTVKLSHTSGTQSVSVTITDDDKVHLSLSLSENSVCEGVEMMDIIVKLESAIERDVVVRVDSFDKSAKEFEDYNSLSQSLTFVAPMSAQSVVTTSVEILDDNEVEPCEEFIIELSSLSERAVVEGDGKAVVQINDNEEIDDFYLTNNSPQINGKNLTAYYKLIGCAQVFCNVSYGTKEVECSPPIGSYDGYWHVSECTRRVTSQNLCMKVNPYCGQASKSLRRMFRTDNRQCGVHFTDRQYEIDSTTGDVIIEWEGTGPNVTHQVKEFMCRLDDGNRYSCFSPLTLKGLTPGNHNISVDPVPIEGCDRDVARSITFIVL